MTPEQQQRVHQLEGLAEGLDQRGEKSAAHLIRLAMKDLEEARRVPDPMHDIAAFHERFGLEYSGPPRSLDVDLGSFRSKFMLEEVLEYAGLPPAEQRAFIEALGRHIPDGGTPPLEAQLDAIVDLNYVSLGTAYLHGFDYHEAWRRVHAANMRKVRARRDGADSLRGSPFDVVKPVGWRPADLSDLVRS